MPSPVALVWELLARDNASPAFLKAAASADKMAAAGERAAKGSEAASARMSAAGAKMTKGFTLPLLGIAAVGVDMAAKFQQSTNVLVTAAGESVKNLGMIRKGILDIATSTGTSWKSVTDGMYQLEKAGYRGADALKVETAAAQGAREEGASLATVTAAMTSIMASYHIKAAGAVMVMNEMKTAAGESKTTMEQFAGSLSTVLPLASANKISFADVAGSLAQLTQHGTTADEAAQELAFTMRGLSAPNQVAQKEMAQLGISSVNVAQKLGDGPGGRGLAGTLNYLSQTVLSKMGKSGLVLLSTFNASAMAAKDATTEFAALPPAAQKVAKAYADGSSTLKEYRADLKALPAPLAALVSQWATTQNSSKGFQQSLRSGVSGSQTYSDAIKKMTGGAAGLNTVLQLTGGSMDGTNERIKRISASAANAGNNVEGWASTQKLFAVQLDIFKQKLAASAIEIGTALIPVLTKVVSAVTSAFGWFSKLSGTQKTMIEWGVGIVAALGPVLSIIGNLMRAFGLLVGLGSRIIGFGASIIGTFTTVGAASTELASTAAINAAAFATVEAEKAAATAEASVEIAAALEGTDSLLAAEASAAAAAAIEFSAAMSEQAAAAVASAESIAASETAVVAASEEAGAASSLALGPVGIAIGAVVGVGALAAHALGLFGGSAKAAVKPTDDFTNAIRDDNDAIGKNTGLLIANKLEKGGLYDAGLKLGISQRTLTQAEMGNSNALVQVNAAIKGYSLETSLAELGGKKLTATQRSQQDAVVKLRSGLGDLNQTLRVNKQAADNVDKGLGTYKAKADAATSSTKQTAAGLAGLSGALTLSKTEAAGLSSNLKSLGAIHATPKLNLIGAALAASQLAAVNAEMNALHDRTIHLMTVTSASADYSPGGMARHAAGGSVKDGYFTAGEEGYEIGHKSGNRVSFMSHAQSVAATGMSKIPGYASGTAGALKQVIAEIVASLKGAPTSIAGNMSVFQPDRRGAVNTQAASDRALESYKKLNAEAIKLTATANGSAKAAHAHAQALSNEAHAAQRAFEALGSTTKANKAAKASAEAHARALADEARTASQSASRQVAASKRISDAATSTAAKARSAYDTLKAAAASAASAAETSAAAVVTAIQSQFSTLQSTVQAFTSSIASGIEGDHSLTTLFGVLGTAATTAASDLKTANDAVTAAQQAITAAGPAAVSSVQSQAAAEQQLVDARNALTAATKAGGPGTAAAIAAQVALTNATSAYAAASAASATVTATGPTAADYAALATAQAAAATAQTAYNTSVAANGVAGLQTSLSSYLATVQGFNKDLTALVASGANQNLITQIVGMGDASGDTLAQQLLVAGPKAISSLQTTMQSISDAAGKESTTLAGSFFGQGASTLDNLAAGIVKAFPEFAKTVDPIVKQIAAMFTFTATVSPAAAGKAIPKHSAGVTNFGGGLAYVHAGELLVNMPTGTNVIPAAQVVSAGSGNTAADNRALLMELRGLRSEVQALRGDTVATGNRVSKTVGQAVRGAGGR